LESDVADTNANIGKLIYIQGDLSEARNYYLKSLKLYKENENEFGEAAMYTEIGIIHEKKKEYDKALKYYDKAMKIQIRLKLDGKLAYSCFQTAVLYEHQNQWNLASKYYQKSIQLSEKIGTKEMLSKALSRKGALEIKKGITEKAKEQIKLGFSLARELNDPELIKEAAAAKLTLAIATEDYKLAYEMECLKNEINNKIKKDEEIELEKQNAQIIEEQSDLLTLKNNELASKNEIINKQMHELEDLIQKLQESNESLNQFAAVAAHDLKAPLRNIQGFSQLLYKKYTGQLPEKDIALFMHIINSCTSLKELIDGLLNYSKISNIKFKLDCVDLSELVADVKNNLSNIIKETKVVLHIAEGMPMVTGQYSLLFQVFLNFMNNAIKFRRKKEGLQSEIWVNSEFYNDDQIKISIKDNGIGIEKEHQDQIFGIFKKLHSNSEYEGSGIGLSVCKKIIERLSGKVWLESEKNVGTTFFFTLKLHLFRSKDW